jgi:hypothetical protein
MNIAGGNNYFMTHKQNNEVEVAVYGVLIY